MRPWVYQMANRLGLLGSVLNDAQGVLIHLQGGRNQLQNFLEALQDQKQLPSQAEIVQCSINELPVTDYNDFEILHSESLLSGNHNRLGTDLAVCSNCLAEFHDPENRRYHDPFISCGDCGPRFSIQYRQPYDRNRTSMGDFVLCSDCQLEYETPSERRFHIEGTCCPKCGPQLELYNAEQTLCAQGEEAIQQLAERILAGDLVAVKGIGGFHIVCDATNPKAVVELRKRKRRTRKPLAIMCLDLPMAKKLARIDEFEAGLLQSPAAPIVLLDSIPETIISSEIAPDTEQLGIMLAYSPIHHLLFEYLDCPLVATSANLSGEPIIHQTDQLFVKLCRPDALVVDWVLSHNREIVNPCDDSVLQTLMVESESYFQTLRLGRGLAPFYGFLAESVSELRPALALGAQQKSAIALADETQWMLSPYIGDLLTFETQQRYESRVQRLMELTQIEPEKLVTDLHPDYYSSQFAKKYVVRQAESARKIVLPLSVQHHYAHLLAVKAEYNLKGETLAFCWDGSGLGSDGSLWGGEVLLANDRDFKREFSLRPFPLLGGEKASKEPRRIALVWLLELFGLEAVNKMHFPCVQSFSELEIQQLETMRQKDLSSPLTSSIGRLFDGVASLLGLVQELDYEGQSGALLVGLYNRNETAVYHFELENGLIDWQPFVIEVLEDLSSGQEVRCIASKFIHGLANLIVEISERYSQVPILLTGGVFQNRTLLELTLKQLQGREVYFQQKTPMNDGSIALGQLWYSQLNQFR